MPRGGREGQRDAEPRLGGHHHGAGDLGMRDGGAVKRILNGLYGAPEQTGGEAA